jgi:hypothetical protein
MTPVLIGVVPFTNGEGMLDVVLSLLGSIDRRCIPLSIPLLLSIDALGMVTSLLLSVDSRAPVDVCSGPESVLIGSPLLVTRESSDLTVAVLDDFLQKRNISVSSQVCAEAMLPRSCKLQAQDVRLTILATRSP